MGRVKRRIHNDPLLYWIGVLYMMHWCALGIRARGQTMLSLPRVECGSEGVGWIDTQFPSCLFYGLMFMNLDNDMGEKVTWAAKGPMKLCVLIYEIYEIYAVLCFSSFSI